jgi:hypothetical protein
MLKGMYAVMTQFWSRFQKHLGEPDQPQWFRCNLTQCISSRKSWFNLNQPFIQFSGLAALQRKRTLSKPGERQTSIRCCRAPLFDADI